MPNKKSVYVTRPASALLFVAALVFGLFGCGSSGGGGSSPTVTTTPTPSPSPTAAFGPLSASTSSLTFSGTGATFAQAVSLSDPNYNGAFSVSGCTGILTYSASSSSPVTLTPQAAGSCTITVSDSAGHTVTISASVTTLSVPVD